MERKRWEKFARISLTNSISGGALLWRIWVIRLRGTEQLFIRTGTSSNGRFWRVEEYLKLPQCTGLRLVTREMRPHYRRQTLLGLDGCNVVCFDHLFAHIIRHGQFDYHRYEHEGMEHLHRKLVRIVRKKINLSA
jgi:hypothetical protein